MLFSVCQTLSNYNFLASFKNNKDYCLKIIFHILWKQKPITALNNFYKLFTYHSCLNVDIHLIPQLPPPLTQYWCAQEKSGWPMSIPPPPVHLSHKMHGRFGGGIVKCLQRPRSALTGKQTCCEFLLCNIVILDEGERANVAFRCKVKEKQ